MIVSARLRPRASDSLQPNVVSASGFQAVIVPSGSIEMNASCVVLTISRKCASLARSASSARFRSVMSVEIPQTAYGTRDASSSGNFVERYVRLWSPFGPQVRSQLGIE